MYGRKGQREAYLRQCAKMARWFEYGEYLGVDFDTDTMTAVVRER